LALSYLLAREIQALNNLRRGHTPFSREDDVLLTKYIGTYNPTKKNRTGQILYKTLVENVILFYSLEVLLLFIDLQIEGRWSWSSRHSWQSWRERYVKNQPFFDFMIAKWQKRHNISDEPQHAKKIGQKRKAPVDVVIKTEKKPRVVNRSVEKPASHEPLEKRNTNEPPHREERKAVHENKVGRSGSVASNDYTGEIYDDETEGEEEEKEMKVEKRKEEEEEEGGEEEGEEEGEGEEGEEGEEEEVLDELARDDGDDNHDHDAEVGQEVKETTNHNHA
jgi:hypothetical protein